MEEIGEELNGELNYAQRFDMNNHFEFGFLIHLSQLVDGDLYNEFNPQLGEELKELVS